MSLPRYPEYKDSGVEWLGEVPAHWSIRPLKSAYRIVGGSTPKSDVAEYWDGDISWVTPADLSRLGGFDIRDSLRKITADGLQSCGSTLVPAGSIVLSTRAPIGSLGLAVSELCTNQGCKSLVPQAGQHSKFLAYLLSIAGAALNVRGKGTTFVELSADELGRFPVSLPSGSDQIEIAAFLDRETARIDALIAEQEKLLALLAEKRQATISHAVTRGLDPNVPMKDSGIAWLGEVPAHWIVTRCGRFISILSGFAFPSTGFDHGGGGTRLLRGVNVAVGSLRWDDTVYWERSSGDGLDDYELKVDDLVIGMDRPLIAAGMRVAKVKEEDVPCLLLQRVALIRTSIDLASDFLMHYLSTAMFVAHFAPETTGVSVPHISPDQIASFTIAVPPVSEQQEIVEYLRRELALLEELSEQGKRTIDLLKERRSALISAAVTGQIDVRGLVDAEAA